MCQQHEPCAGVGYGRHARFAEQPHRKPVERRLQVSRDVLCGGRMLVQLKKCEVINGCAHVYAAEVAPGGAYFFHYEMTDGAQQI